MVSAGVGASVERDVGDVFDSDVDACGAGVEADAVDAGVGVALSASVGARAATDVASETFMVL